jgi:cyclic pyranopterin phosphate synthase
MAKRLSHVDAHGAARMVDVGQKPATERRATARGLLRVGRETIELVRRGDSPKGDVLGTARIAGIMAAKKTSELIPLSHPLPLSHIDIELGFSAEGIEIEATAATTAQTGVELEAMTAVAVAGLTLYDMVKAVEKGARLTDVRLVRKTGGKSGELVLE